MRNAILIQPQNPEHYSGKAFHYAIKMPELPEEFQIAGRIYTEYSNANDTTDTKNIIIHM